LEKARPSLPIDVGSEKQLFIDDSFTRSAAGVRLVMNPPDKTGEMNLIADKPWEAGLIGGFTVLQDGGLYKAWYSAWPEKVVNDLDTRLCYAESEEGVHFTKPNLGLIEYQGSKANNIVFEGVGDGMHAGTVFLDPAAPPEERFKLVYLSRNGINGAVSPDGLRWNGWPEVILKLISDTQNVAFWDPSRASYLLFVRTWLQDETVRAIGRAESPDFRHFPSHETVIQPDEQDPPYVDLYTNAALKYPWAANAYFIFTAVYDHRNKGPLDIQLCTSRDSLHWRRTSRYPYIPRGVDDDFDTGSLYMASGIVQTGEQLSLYYGAFTTGHRMGEKPYGGIMSRVTLRPDRFVSYDAGKEEGVLITHPLRFTGRQLHLNGQTTGDGRIAVDFLDADGRPIPGFSEGDALSGDFVDRTVTWAGKEDLGSLAGKPVSLRFRMRRARLYAFHFR
jgi:hypothetical protein